ncbi:MAG: hypothetical protein JW864_16435 [Spirochaetes bacterium]|nr:hypothetical protein [Spirochaetota bacterium]
MKKLANFFLFIIITLISYFLLSNLLFKLDDTPAWYEIKHPEHVIAGKPVEVLVKYHDMKTGYRLSATLHLFNKSGQYQGCIKANEPLRIIHGNGAAPFKFIIKKSDLKNKDISFVRINVNRFELPISSKKSIYNGRRIGNTVSSASIPIVKPNPDGSIPEVKTSSILQIVKHAVLEGTWIKFHGDNTFEGWFITAVYFIIFILYVQYLLRVRKNPENIEKNYMRFILITAILTFILGINKQLDLQMLLTDIGRTHSKIFGWYNIRRPAQVRFISIFASLATGVVILSAYNLRKLWRKIFLQTTGLFILFGFIIIKGSSHHKLDHFFSKKILGMSMFGVFEIIGLALIGISAITGLFKDKSATNNISDINDKGF